MLCACMVRRRSLIDGTVIPSSSVEQHGPFSKNGVGKRPETPSSAMQVLLRERFEPPCEYQPDQPCSGSTRRQQSPQEPATRKKTAKRSLLQLSQSGRKGQAVFCYSLQLSKQSCFLAFKQHSLQTSWLLILHFAFLTVSLRPSAVSC